MKKIIKVVYVEKSRKYGWKYKKVDIQKVSALYVNLCSMEHRFFCVKLEL